MKALRPSASHVRLIGCGPIIGRCDQQAQYLFGGTYLYS